MFKLTRRTLTGLTVVAALAAGAGTAGTTTAIANGTPAGLGPLFGPDAFTPNNAAEGCSKWRIPAHIEISQSNRWYIWSSKRLGAQAWWVQGEAGAGTRQAGTMRITRFRSNDVRFTITWRGGTAGIYTATIDEDGFLIGTSRDKFNPRVSASFRFTHTVECASRGYKLLRPRSGSQPSSPVR